MHRLFTLLAFALVLFSLRGEEMRLELTPGSYASHAAEVAEKAPETLTVVGNADVRDLRAIAETLPPSVNLLNMQSLVIEGYAYPYNHPGDRGYYPEATIPGGTFAYAGFSSILFPVSLVEIGEGAFAGSALTFAGFPSELRRLGDFAFAGCGELETFEFCAPLEYLGAGAFRNCAKLIRADLYPTEITYIPDGLFAGCDALEEVFIPSVAKHIGSEVFAGSGLKEVKMPYGAVCEPFALASMKKLERVDANFPEAKGGLLFDTPSLIEAANAGYEAADLHLAGSSITDSRLTETFGRIGDYGLAGIGNTSVNLAAGLTSVGRGAFYGMARLRYIQAERLGATVPEIGEDGLEGIDPSRIYLIVDSLSTDVWKEHPVWSRFEIVANNNSAVDAITGQDEMKISASAGLITVSGPDAISSVSVYSTDGAILYASAPRRDTHTLDSRQWHGMIVIVDAADTAGRRCRKRLLL